MTLLLLAAAQAIACKPLEDGPAEGMCVATKPGPHTSVLDLLPAPHAGPPLSPQTASNIEQLLASYDNRRPIPTILIAVGATQEFCPEFSDACFLVRPLDTWRLKSGYTHSAPYLLSDGRIRIEWLFQGRLRYVSFVTLERDKAKDLSTSPAQMAFGSAR